MDRTVALAKGKHRAEHWMAHEEALALARSGRLQAARRSSSRAVDLALQEGVREDGSELPGRTSRVGSRLRECCRRKKERYGGARAFERPGCRIRAALALALSGDSSRSEALAEDLEKRFPEDTFVKFTYVPVLRALAALGRGKPADSVERLQIALRYELAVNGLNFNHFYLGGLHSAYVRGEALWPPTNMGKRRPSFKRSWIIAALSARIPSALWRICNSAECSLCRETRPRQRLPTGFSHALEGRRRRHPGPPAGQGRVRPAAVSD